MKSVLTFNGSGFHSSPDLRRLIIEILLVLFTFALFWPSTRCGFVWDDDEYILKNQHVTAGITPANIRWALTAYHSANWHPLAWMSHQLDCRLYSLKPAGHHLTNILLHCCCAVLLFQLLAAAGLSLRTSAIVAALFACHPLNVETVTWISQRKSLLSMFFLLGSMRIYVSWVRSKRRPLFVVSIVAFAAALCSKPMAVSLPVLLLLLDWWPLRRIGAMRRGEPATRIGTVIAEKIPFFVLAVGISVIAVAAQSAGGAVKSLDHLPVANRIVNTFVLYWEYVFKLAFPLRLAAFYPYTGTFALWKIAAAVGATTTVCTIAVIRAYRSPWLFIGWGWFLTALLPMIGIIQVGGQSIADRYAYLPMIGIFLIIIQEGERCTKRIWRRVSAAVAGGVLLLFFMLTLRQQAYWKDAFTLYHRMLQVCPSPLAHINLGSAYLESGNCPQAERHLLKAIELDDTKVKTYTLLINTLIKCKEYAKASDAVSGVVERYPNEVPLLTSRAWIWSQTGKPQEAIRSLKAMLNLGPDDTDIRSLIAVIAQQQHDHAEAIDQFTRLLKNGTDTVQMRYNRAEAYFADGQYREARMDIDTLMRLYPYDPAIRRLAQRIEEGLRALP